MPTVVNVFYGSAGILPAINAAAFEAEQSAKTQRAQRRFYAFADANATDSVAQACRVCESVASPSGDAPASLNEKPAAI
jgi:hypothetical protein